MQPRCGLNKPPKGILCRFYILAVLGGQNVFERFEARTRVYDASNVESNNVGMSPHKERLHNTD